jgi:hypothetical protein
MICEGMVKEGLSITKGVRDRHRGDRRNPWDEFECGHHYARSMASYALLLALTGFKYSAPQKHLGFAPKINKKDFITFFSTATGWGLYTQKIGKEDAKFSLELKYGSLCLDELELPKGDTRGNALTVTLNGKKINAKIKKDRNNIKILFDSVLIEKNQTLKIRLS